MVHHRTFPTPLFLLLFLVSLLFVYFSGNALGALSSEYFGWDQTMLLDQDNGSKVELTFSHQKMFLEQSIIHARIKVTSTNTTDTTDTTDTGDTGDTVSDSELEFMLPELPPISSDDKITLTDPHLSVLPPLIATGFALLFVQNPQLSDRRRGSSLSMEQSNSFINQCELSVPPATGDKRTLIIQEAQGITSSAPTCTSVTIDLFPDCNNSDATSSAYHVRFSIVCYAESVITRSVYDITDHDIKTAPFLYFPLLEKFDHYFKADLPSGINFSSRKPDTYSRTNASANSGSSIFCCGCKTK